MWCFIDESWAEHHHGGRVGVIFAVAVAGTAIPVVDHELYSVRKQWYGPDHAKDATIELKGSALLSKSSFRLAAHLQSQPHRNHCVAREVLTFCGNKRQSLRLNAFAAIVFGADPKLDCLDPRRLELPFRDMLVSISACCASSRSGDRVVFVMDQRGRA